MYAGAPKGSSQSSVRNVPQECIGQKDIGRTGRTVGLYGMGVDGVGLIRIGPDAAAPAGRTTYASMHEDCPSDMSP